MLRDGGFPGSRSKLDQVADFLTQNEFWKVETLAKAIHPKEWCGAWAFTEVELAEIWKMCR